MGVQKKANFGRIHPIGPELEGNRAAKRERIIPLILLLDIVLCVVNNAWPRNRSVDYPDVVERDKCGEVGTLIARYNWVLLQPMHFRDNNNPANWA